MTSFPTSIVILPNPLSNTKQGTVVTNLDHAAQHGNANDEIEAVETKLGITIGSAQTPIAGTVLHGGAVAGTSAWQEVQTVDIAADAVTQAPAVAVGTTDPTLNSATITALANPTLAMTSVSGSEILIWAGMTISTTAADLITLYVRVDGGSWTSLGIVSPPAGSGRYQIVGFHRYTGLSAASHTYELGWNTTAVGNATSYGTTRRLMALECKR